MVIIQMGLENTDSWNKEQRGSTKCHSKFVVQQENRHLLLEWHKKNGSWKNVSNLQVK